MTRFIHTRQAICATSPTGRVLGAVLKRPAEWSDLLWDEQAPKVCQLLDAQPSATAASLLEQGYLKPAPGASHIKLSAAEIQSGVTRVQWAERLILQLPEQHDGRNSWLLNYGSTPCADFTPARPPKDDLEQWVNYGLALYQASFKKDELIADLQSRLAATQARTNDWQEGDTVRFTGRTGQWYVNGQVYRVGKPGAALRPGSTESVSVPGLQIQTEIGHYCTWALTALAHKFEFVRSGAEIKKDHLVADLHLQLSNTQRALTATQRAVGEAQTTPRSVKLSEAALRALLSAHPGEGAVFDHSSNTFVGRS